MWIRNAGVFKKKSKIVRMKKYNFFKGEVVSYNLSCHPNLSQVTDMLNQAFAKIPDNTDLIPHSDQGWQYQHKHYQKMLKIKVSDRVCLEKPTVLITPVPKISLAYSKPNYCIYRSLHLLNFSFPNCMLTSNGTTTSASRLSLMAYLRLIIA